MTTDNQRDFRSDLVEILTQFGPVKRIEEDGCVSFEVRRARPGGGEILFSVGFPEAREIHANDFEIICRDDGGFEIYDATAPEAGFRIWGPNQDVILMVIQQRAGEVFAGKGDA